VTTPVTLWKALTGLHLWQPLDSDTQRLHLEHVPHAMSYAYATMFLQPLSPRVFQARCQHKPPARLTTMILWSIFPAVSVITLWLVVDPWSTLQLLTLCSCLHCLANPGSPDLARLHWTQLLVKVTSQYCRVNWSFMNLISRNFCWL